MERITLDLDELEVESFEAETESAEERMRLALESDQSFEPTPCRTRPRTCCL